MISNSPTCIILREKMPTSWDVVPLANVTDFQEGPGILAKDFTETGVPLLRLRNIERTKVNLEKSNFLDPEKVAKKWAHFALKEGDLLISTSASLGRVSVVGPEAVGSVAYTGIIRFRSSSEKLDHNYLRAFLSSSAFIEQAEQMATGSVIKHFGPSHLKQMAIVLPSLDEQVQFASIFDALDNRISLLNETNTTLEAIAQALFKSWFIDFDPVHAKHEGREPEGMGTDIASLFPSSFEESVLGLVPTGWHFTPLETVATVIMGLSPKGDSYNSNAIGVPLINGPVEFGDYFPLQTKWTDCASRMAKESDLIFCVRGSTTGRRVVSDSEYCIGRGVCAIRANKSSYGFIYQTINFGLDRLLSKTTGSVFPSLSSPDIKNFQVLNPKEAMINAYENTTKPFLHRIQENHRQAQTLADLRDTLLPRLISGQLRLPDAEALVEAAAA